MAATNSPGIDGTFLLIARRWRQEKCDDSTSFVNRQFASELKRSGYGVLSTVLEASKEELDDAEEQGVTLILPKEKERSYRIHKDDWLMHPNKYYKALKKYKNVSYIVGHVNGKGYDTIEEARIIRETYFENATLVVFIHVKPSNQGYGSYNVIGANDIKQAVAESGLVVVIGHSLNGHYLNLLRPEQNRVRMLCYLPFPDKEYLKLQVKTPPQGANTEVLTVTNFSDTNEKGSCESIGLAIAKVTDQIRLVWKLCDINNEEDVTSFQKRLNTELGLRPKAVLPVSLENYSDLPAVYQQSSLLIDTSSESFSVTGLNAIAAGLPVIFDINSSIAQLLHLDSFLQIDCGLILVEVGLDESITRVTEAWAEKIRDCVARKELAFARAARLRDGLKKSIDEPEGTIKQSHEKLIDWFKTNSG